MRVKITLTFLIGMILLFKNTLFFKKDLLMNIKKFLLVLLLADSSAMNAFFVEKEVFRCIENHKSAFLELQKQLSDISVSSWTSYNCTNHSYDTHYNYWCFTDAARKNLTTYQEAEKTLNNKIMLNAFGDGFLLGVIAACCNKALKGETLNKKLILPILACALGMIMYQNHKLGTVPYFDAELNKHHTQFENTSFYTVGRIVCALFSASVGYFGTDYTLNKIGYALHDLQNN